MQGEKGLNFVFLSPINTEIYRRYGFGYMSSLEKYSISMENIPFERIDRIYEIKKASEEKNLYGDLIEIYKEKWRIACIFRERWKLLQKGFERDGKWKWRYLYFLSGK